jgi:glutamate-ammonia-ligase adenylyltransferase
MLKIPSQWYESAEKHLYNPERTFTALEEMLKNHPNPSSLISYLNERRFILLTRLLDYSNCLRKFLIKHPTAFEENIPGLWYKFKKKETYLRELEKLLHSSKKDISTVLAYYRHYELLRIFAKELLNTASLEEILAEYSALADALVDIAYQHALRRNIKKYGEPIASDGSLATGLILGLGKLGSEELNYYSDIDLIFFHSTDKGKAGSISVNAFFEKVFKDLVEILTKNTEEGKPYIVDLDLRPFGKSGPISMPIRSAELYYESYGRTWERYALLRARYIAGNKGLAEWFTENIQIPFVYKQPLDSKAISEIRLMKKKLENLTRKKTLTQRNLKTMKGGIREVEFTVQTLQIILGKDSPFLRERNTFRAIWKLHLKGIFSDEEAYSLEKAYNFLRKLEHRIQLKECVQTQNLKKEDELFYAKALDFPDVETFREKLEEYTTIVHNIFKNVLPEREKEEKISDIALAVITQDLKILREKYPDSSPYLLERLILTLSAIWEGREGIHLTEREKENFIKWVPYIVEKILKSPFPEITLTNFIKFLQNPTGRKLLFLQPSEKLYATLFKIFSVSAYLTNKIYISPDLVEDILTLYKDYPTKEEIYKDLEEFKKARNTDYINLIRRFETSWTIRIALIFLTDDNKDEGILKLMKSLSELTEVVIEDVWKTLGFEGIPLVLFALGKFGSKELTFASDLDLIFTFRDQETKIKYLNKPKEFISFLTTHTREGYLYKVDFRLRPMGTKGELSPPLEYYIEYFRKYARVWEKLAWVRSRYIVGDKELAQKLEEAINEFLFAKPLTEEEEKEIVKMRLKLQQYSKERRGLYNVKSGFGGIMDIEFLMQYLTLKEKRKIENTFEALEEFSKKYSILSDLKGAYKFLRLLETFNRLIKPSGGSLISKADFQKIAPFLGVTAEELEEELKKTRKMVRDIFLEFFQVS